MPALLQRILVVTDRNPAAKDALVYASRLANHFESELHLMFMLRPSEEDGVASPESGLAVSWRDIKRVALRLPCLSEFA